MFSGCRLSLTAIQNIANCINNISGKEWDGTYYLTPTYRHILDIVPEDLMSEMCEEHYGKLTLGIDASLEGTAELEEALEAIKAKGWTIEEEYN